MVGGASRALRLVLSMVTLAALGALAFCALPVGGAGAGDGGKGASAGAVGPELTWTQDGEVLSAAVALDRIAVAEDDGRGELHVSRLKTSAASLAELRALLRRRADALSAGDDASRVVGAVLYQGERDRATRLISVGDVIVSWAPSTSAAERRALARRSQLRRSARFSFSNDTFLYRAADPLAALSAATTLERSPAVEWATPSLLRLRTERVVPDDPLFGSQWHLRNTGQRSGTAGVDINVTPVWGQSVGGTPLRGTPNEVIAIADDGVEIGHPDLAANVLPGRSWDWADADDDPSPSRSSKDQEYHGTGCAGVAAARGFNGLGVSGVAPAAGLVGFRFLVDNVDSDAVEAEVLAAVRPDPGNRDIVDIVSNSWGPADDRHLDGPGPLTQAALLDGVTNGRGGRGLIYVWAGGNGRQEADDVNYDGYASSRYTIAVGACTNRGKAAPYSEGGAALALVAPSSDGVAGTQRDITTVDLTGSAGYTGTDYDNGFGGTSAAAPQVAGIVALMLQAAPELTWRDVQVLLKSTARTIDPAHPDWTTNAAGHQISHTYGFGLVDAAAAVAAARSWRLLGAEKVVSATATPNRAIRDASTSWVTSAITLGATRPRLVIEHVEVELDAPHDYWHDLEVVLIAPSGTQSVLSPPAAVSSAHEGGFNGWTFSSVRHLGESSQGTWKLRVRDRYRDDTGRFAKWTLRVYGTAAPPDTEPPVTRVTPGRRWWNRSVKLTLSATDVGSNVARTTRRVGRSSTGRYTSGSVVRITVPKRGHKKDGRHVIWYRSYDNSGNAEQLRKLTVNIDTRRPRTRMLGRARVRRGRTAVLRFRVDERGFSARRAHVYLQVLKRRGQRGWRSYRIVDLGWRKTNRRDVYRWRRCPLPKGRYKVRIRCRDKAGNTHYRMGTSTLIVR